MKMEWGLFSKERLSSGQSIVIVSIGLKHFVSLYYRNDKKNIGNLVTLMLGHYKGVVYVRNK